MARGTTKGMDLLARAATLASLALAKPELAQTAANMASAVRVVETRPRTPATFDLAMRAFELGYQKLVRNGWGPIGKDMVYPAQPRSRKRPMA